MLVDCQVGTKHTFNIGNHLLFLAGFTKTTLNLQTSLCFVVPSLGVASSQWRKLVFGLQYDSGITLTNHSSWTTKHALNHLEFLFMLQVFIFCLRRILTRMSGTCLVAVPCGQLVLGSGPKFLSSLFTAQLIKGITS